MPSIKINRISEQIKEELPLIFRTVKDPRVSKMISVIRTEVTSDLSFCKVYISAIEGSEKTKETVEGLKSASGYIRREISKRLKLRKAPEMHFIADDSIEYSANINKMLIDEFKKHPVKPETEEPDKGE